MKEIIAKVHTEVNEGMSPDEMIQKFVDIARRSVQFAPYFSPHVLPRETMKHIAVLNRRGGFKGRKWHLDHLRQPWLAGKCPFKNGDLFLEPETIMQIWAYSDIVLRKIGAFRQAAPPDAPDGNWLADLLTALEEARREEEQQSSGSENAE
jgi:hypothetical protein